MDMPVTTGAREELRASTITEEDMHRAGLYTMLAALLRDAPGGETLAHIGAIDIDRDEPAELAMALSMLALAARGSAPENLQDEYHQLFIGLGRGELVPYGSWYQTGFLMEKPLGVLRQDLGRLGFERSADTHEPEDHIAALAEVMSMLIQDGTPLEVQRQFFDSHIGPWAVEFFRDLGEAPSAIFYRSVARLGATFIGLEARHLSLLD